MVKISYKEGGKRNESNKKDNNFTIFHSHPINPNFIIFSNWRKFKRKYSLNTLFLSGIYYQSMYLYIKIFGYSIPFMPIILVKIS